MKILFLDIDGVLNSLRYDRERTPEQGNIDESRLPLLKEIVEESGAQIVLSSSWREHWAPEEGHCDAVGLELNRLFQKYGLQISDKTPQISPRQRAAEIQDWLTAHANQVDAFAILDDTFAGWGDLQDHLVKTDSRIGRGLEPSHVRQVIRLLSAHRKSRVF